MDFCFGTPKTCVLETGYGYLCGKQIYEFSDKLKMTRHDKKNTLDTFLSRWIKGDKDLEYLKEKDHECFSEFTSLARVLEIHDINVTSSMDIETSNNQSPDFIVHVTDPKLYIEVVRAGTGYTMKDKFYSFIDDLLDEAKDNDKLNRGIQEIKDSFFIPLYSNTQIEDKHALQCAPIFCSKLLNDLSNNKKINNLDPIDKYSFIQSLLLFCNKKLSKKQNDLKGFNEYYDLCIRLLGIQLVDLTDIDSGSAHFPLRNRLISSLKPLIENFANCIDKHASQKLPTSISQYCNSTNTTEDVYYAFVDSIVSQLLKKMSSTLELLTNFKKNYPTAGDTNFYSDDPEKRDVDQILKAIENKFTKYNRQEKHDNKGVLVVKLQSHIFNIFNSSIATEYAAQIVKSLNDSSVENTYFNEVLIIGHPDKKDQIYICKSENKLWELS